MGFYHGHAVGGGAIKGYVAFSDETLRREGMLDVQVELTPVYDEAFGRSLGSSNVASFRTLQRALRERDDTAAFRRHLGNVLDDLATWRRHTAATAPVPVVTPRVIRRWLDAEPADRVNVIAEVFGDLALMLYTATSGRLPLERIDVTTRLEQAPNPDSRIRLSADRDHLGVRRVELDWRLTPLDRFSMVRALEILGAELGRADLGRLQITLPADDADGWPEALRGGWHHIGTTRMSDDPAQGVVDRDCRVHGVANLFVAGSSVFPTSGSGTPTLALVALALRLADHVAARVC
jgi:choline dehydrogenase-like flavoprotein